MQKLLTALALLSALVFAQIPELMQQYRQRLGGAADELSIVVRNFDDDSRRSGYDRSSALNVMKQNSERLVTEQGHRMDDYVTRLNRLNSQQSAMANGITPTSIIAVAFDYDGPTMSQAKAAFSPAIPMTMTSLMCALVGFILCCGLCLGLGAIFSSDEKSNA